MYITDNFTLSEMCKSSTAEKEKIDNTPDTQSIINLTHLCLKVLQPIRDFAGWIVVSSGYRCKELQRIIGSSATSQHTCGMAADIKLPLKNQMTHGQLANWIANNLVFDQLILEFFHESDPHSGWIHVSINTEPGSANRLQCLRAVKEDGKTVYVPILDHFDSLK